jgi:hypothetical protein
LINKDCEVSNTMTTLEAVWSIFHAFQYVEGLEYSCLFGLSMRLLLMNQ